MELANLIKEKRKKLGLTQKELSEGICTQALISRVENGDIIPNQIILYKIGKRLNIDEEELNRLTNSSKYKDRITQLKDTIRKFLTKRDYKTIELILYNNESLINEITHHNDLAFFSWIEASLEDKIYNHSDEALKLLNQISLKNVVDELAIEILNAIGVIYYRNGLFDEALGVFSNGVNIIEEDTENNVQVKLLLNYALTLEELDNDKKALEVINQAIKLQVENESLFILGDLYHTKAHLLRKLEHLLEAKKNNQLALSIFEIQHNNEFITMTQLEIKEIIDELEHTHAIDYMS